MLNEQKQMNGIALHTTFTRELSFPITVGITGHRTLPQEHLAQISAQVEDVLCTIQKETENAASSCGFPPLLRLISNLSEGSDRLAAEHALTLGWRLQAVLPFPLGSPIHGRDLDEDARRVSVKQLERLCGQAETVIQLSHDVPPSWRFAKPPLDDPNSDHPLAAAFRQDGYFKASEVVVEQCDILLALWNGEPQTAQGSTFETLSRALERHVPVIIISTDEDVPPRMVSDAKALWQTVSPLLPDAVHAFFASSFPGEGQTSEAMLTMMADAEASAQKPIPRTAGLWKLFQKTICRGKLGGLPSSLAAPAADPLLDMFDSAANYYASVQRSAVIKVACLSILSVLFSSFSILLPEGMDAGTPLSLLEIATLLCVVWTVRSIRRNAWQTKLTRHRYVAEVLRLNAYTRKFAVDCPFGMQRSFYENTQAEDAWLTQLLRMLVRYRGLSSIDYSDRQALRQLKEDTMRDLLHDQMCYHALNSRRSSMTNDCLEKFCDAMFWAALLSSAVNLSSGTWLPSGLLSFISTVGPAAAISAQSVSQNTELKRLTMRSNYMRKELSETERALRETQAPDEIRSLLLSAVRLMLADSVDWKSQYNIENVNL